MKKRIVKKAKEDTSQYLFSNTDLKRLIEPLIIEQLLAVTVGLADSMMVASVGEAAVSAVSLADAVFVLLINLFAALATGGAVVCGQYLGKRRENMACDAANQLLLFIGAFALVITALVYICRWGILHVVFGKISPDVMANCRIYLMIVAASIPFIALYNAGNAIFRSMGDSRTGMFIALIMNAINLAGNAILIFGFHLGVAGVAIPTLLSRMTAAVLVLWKLAHSHQVLHIRLPFSWRFDVPLLKKIMSIGIPNGLENSMFQLGKILVLSMVSGFGTASIAANAVSNNIALFQILPGMSIGFATMTVVSRCAGAGDYEQVRYYTKKLVRLVYLSLIGVNIVVLSVLPLVLRLYNLSAEASGYARIIVWYHAACVVTIWPISFTIPNTFRSCGDVTYTMVLAMISMWVFRIGFSWLLGVVLEMGVVGIWVAMTIDWMFRTIFFGFHYRRGKYMRSAIE